MKTSQKLAVGIAGVLATAGSAYAQDRSLNLRGFDSPYVYVMSNDIQGNNVAVLRRNFFGGLEKVTVVSTQGKGVGVGTTAPPPDPLGSQNALVKSAMVVCYSPPMPGPTRCPCSRSRAVGCV